MKNAEAGQCREDSPGGTAPATCHIRSETAAGVAAEDFSGASVPREAEARKGVRFISAQLLILFLKRCVG
jgi:hypothetical protein